MKATYKEIREYYLNEQAETTAKEVFGDEQPNMHELGHYTPAGTNWSYRVGITTKNGRAYIITTVYGQVKGAHEVHA